MATSYIALLDPHGGGTVHIARQNAEVSLCGLPRAILSGQGTIDDLTVCRDCIDWIPRRWTESRPKVSRS